MRSKSRLFLVMSVLSEAGLMIVCGNDSPTSPKPLPTPARELSSNQRGTIAAHTWTCSIEFMVGPGGVSVDVTPTSTYLQLAGGTCASPRAIVAESNTASLTYSATAGEYHVNVGNPTDASLDFFVRATYLAP